jgi:hypothetical protein
MNMIKKIFCFVLFCTSVLIADFSKKEKILIQQAITNVSCREDVVELFLKRFDVEVNEKNKVLFRAIICEIFEKYVNENGSTSALDAAKISQIIGKEIDDTLLDFVNPDGAEKSSFVKREYLALLLLGVAVTIGIVVYYKYDLAKYFKEKKEEPIAKVTVYDQVPQEKKDEIKKEVKENIKQETQVTNQVEKKDETKTNIDEKKQKRKSMASWIGSGVKNFVTETVPGLLSPKKNTNETGKTPNTTRTPVQNKVFVKE